MEKKINRAKICLGGLLIFLFLCFPAPTQAALWPAIDPIIKQNLEEVFFHINGVILGTLKQAAAKMLNDQVGKLVGGNSVGSAKFITDWRAFLFNDPKTNADLYINDRLTKMTAGKGSPSGYISVGEGFGGGNYMSQLVNEAKKLTSEKPEIKVTFEGDPSQMFASGSFQQMNLYLSGINNPWAFSINAQQEYEKRLKEEEKIKEDQALAYDGFKGNTADGIKMTYKGTTQTSRGEQSSDGITMTYKGTTQTSGSSEIITTPGSVIKEAVVNVQDLGNKILAAATHPEEVITSVVSQIIAQAIEKGIGEIESNINQEINKVQQRLNETTNTGLQQFGPGMQYGNPSSDNSCLGKNNGDSCTLNPPYNGLTSGRCSNGLCWPASN